VKLDELTCGHHYRYNCCKNQSLIKEERGKAVVSLLVDFIVGDIEFETSIQGWKG
jgi:hypothetical protein